jgi:dihydrofolate synthase/folylpolyglutamate synthase
VGRPEPGIAPPQGRAPDPPSLRRLAGLSPRGIKLGLEAIDAVCERLARPERLVPCVLVGGTNGKGSTAAMLASIAHRAGLRTGLYTSPHLIDVTERIRVGRRDASPEELDAALAEVFAASDEVPAVSLTYFEALTAAAFVLFARRKLELAILEVGLGGRLDATNVAPARLSVVTSIGLDHTADLGPTVSAIAREKAGILRRGRPCLVRAEAPEALAALAEVSESVGSLWHDAAREISLSRIETGLSGTRFGLTTPAGMYVAETPLPGEHQAWNAALAVRAAELLGPEFPNFTVSACASGLRAASWPGRLERFEVSGRTVLLDGCHNADGAAAVGRFLDAAGLSGRADLVFGAMADKDVEAMARELLPRVRGALFVPAGTDRAATPEELLRRAGPLSSRALACGSAAEALRRLLDASSSEPIIVAGSLYLVGEARGLLLSGEFQTIR